MKTTSYFNPSYEMVIKFAVLMPVCLVHIKLSTPSQQKCARTLALYYSARFAPKISFVSLRPSQTWQQNGIYCISGTFLQSIHATQLDLGLNVRPTPSAVQLFILPTS